MNYVHLIIKNKNHLTSSRRKNNLRAIIYYLSFRTRIYNLKKD